MKILQKIHVVLGIGLLGIPLVLTPFFPTTETTEAASQSPAPQLIQDGSFNPQFVTDAGNWFSDHYALRQYLITANSLISTHLFKTSPVSQVILGQDGWLFYRDTVDDYTGQSLMNERQLFSLVHNFQLMQWSAQSQNAQFILMIAPNKNSIYPEQMPESYTRSEQKNIALVQQALSTAGVNVCDVYGPLSASKDQSLYYRRDSHWNRRGALLAYDQLMADLGLSGKAYGTMSITSADHKGDLEEILLPKAWRPETDELVDKHMTYTPKLEGDALMENWIETENPQGEGSILLFRDSFGINLVPYLADTFEKGWFSRLEPYNFVQVSSLQPQIVAIEKTERRIRQFIEEAPIMYMPSVSAEPDHDLEGIAELSMESSGDFWKIHGRIEGTDLRNDTDIYLRLKDPNGTVRATVAVFYLCSETSDYEFELYLPQSLIRDQSTCEVLVRNGENTGVLKAAVFGKEQSQ